MVGNYYGSYYGTADSSTAWTTTTWATTSTSTAGTIWVTPTNYTYPSMYLPSYHEYQTVTYERLYREQLPESMRVPAAPERPVDPCSSKEADEKALQLLLETLDEGQKAMLTKEGKFVVFGSKGNGYQVRKNQRTLLLGKDGNGVEEWCFGPEGYIPTYDRMLAQKLLLEANEELAHNVANRTRV